MAPLFALIGIAVAVAIVDLILRIRADRLRQRRAHHRDSGDWSYSPHGEGGAFIDMDRPVGRPALKIASTRLLARIKRIPFRSIGDRLTPAFRILCARNTPDFRLMARSAVRVFRRRDDGL